MAALTGGMVFDVRHPQIDDMLQRFITMLRDRYIVEFPRPDNSAAGLHRIEITIPSHWNFIIKPTGASLPLPDPTQLADPNTIKSGPTTGKFGNNRPAQPKP